MTRNGEYHVNYIAFRQEALNWASLSFLYFNLVADDLPWSMPRRKIYLAIHFFSDTACRVVSRILSSRFHPKSRRLFSFYFSSIMLRTDLLTFGVAGTVFRIAVKYVGCCLILTTLCLSINCQAQAVSTFVLENIVLHYFRFDIEKHGKLIRLTLFHCEHRALLLRDCCLKS